MLLLLLLAIFMVLFTYYVLVLREHYHYFKRIGIPTPPFDYLFGHMNHIWFSSSPSHVLRDWSAKYGKTYGIYVGSVPTIVTSDVEFIHQVYENQYSKFSKHMFSAFLNPLQKDKCGLFSSQGSQWRRQRVISAHLIATGIKEMSSKWVQLIEEEMKVLEDFQQTDTAFDIQSLLTGTFFRVACE